MISSSRAVVFLPDVSEKSGYGIYHQVRLPLSWHFTPANPMTITSFLQMSSNHPFCKTYTLSLLPYTSPIPLAFLEERPIYAKSIFLHAVIASPEKSGSVL